MIAKRAGGILLIAFLLLACVSVLSAAPPVVKTVPWVATNPLVPHDTYPGLSVVLKGTVTNLTGGHTYTYSWDFGDGSAPATGTVTNAYVIEAAHVYTGTTGTVWTATLRVTDTTTGEFDDEFYYVAMRERNLSVEVNVAIDRGLWYLHKTMRRYTGTAGDLGDWLSGGGYATYGYYAVSAINLNALEANGHLETGAAGNPYTETAQRAMRGLLTSLACPAIPATQSNTAVGSYTVDTNGNGYGCQTNQYPNFYQTGPAMDALIASGTPNAVAAAGGTGVLGRTYRDIVQDMADYHSYCAYDGAPYAGGWRYSCNQFPDNSAAQWGAIGLIPAEREWGIEVPAALKFLADNQWLNYSQNSTTGVFGYTDQNPIWGPYGTTPSGMVQLAWVGVGRGNPRWDRAERYMRTNFGNCCGATVSVKDYYYGLFAFVKSMLLHTYTDAQGNHVQEPINLLRDFTGGLPPIDWYSAELSKGDPTDGVARTLVGDQNPAGYWYAHNYTGEQYYLETGMALIMLNRTLFTAGAPVAVISATPNPAVVGAVISLSGADSFHQDASRNIVSWSWDLNNDGVFGDATGPNTTVSFPALGNYPVSLRVTDDSSPVKSATTTVTIVVSLPPVAPTAEAGGPYNYCPDNTPWFLDGRASVNPDDGLSETGRPGDFIKSYEWLLGGAQFATGAVPDVTAFFNSKGIGNYLVTLRVKDNTGTSYPSAGTGDLTGEDTAEVSVRSSEDPVCALCPRNLKAYPKITKIEVTWTYRVGAVKYNVYRSKVSGGPYLKVGEATNGLFVDTNGLVNNPATTYYYVVREVAASGQERCQSNEASALLRRR